MLSKQEKKIVLQVLQGLLIKIRLVEVNEDLNF